MRKSNSTVSGIFRNTYSKEPYRMCKTLIRATDLVNERGAAGRERKVCVILQNKSINV